MFVPAMSLARSLEDNAAGLDKFKRRYRASSRLALLFVRIPRRTEQHSRATAVKVAAVREARAGESGKGWIHRHESRVRVSRDLPRAKARRYGRPVRIYRLFRGVDDASTACQAVPRRPLNRRKALGAEGLLGAGRVLEQRRQLPPIVRENKRNCRNSSSCDRGGGGEWMKRRYGISSCINCPRSLPDAAKTRAIRHVVGVSET